MREGCDRLSRLCFGVLDLVMFSHGSMLMPNGFIDLATGSAVSTGGVANPWLLLVAMLDGRRAVADGFIDMEDRDRTGPQGQSVRRPILPRSASTSTVLPAKSMQACCAASGA